jgi:predicted DNA-binding transcriptional regulator AlpA
MNADSTDFDDLAAATVELSRPAAGAPVTPPRSRGEVAAGVCVPATPAVMRLTLSTEEAAAALGVHASTLRRLHKEGTGPRRLQLTQTRVVYRISDLNLWLDAVAAGTGNGQKSP